MSKDDPTCIELENYRVKSDGSKNWILERKRVANESSSRDTGEIYYTTIGWYPTVQMALKSACEKRLLRSELESMQELINAVKSLELTVERVANGFYLDEVADLEDEQDLLYAFAKTLSFADVENRKIQDEPVLETHLNGEQINFTTT